MLVDRDRRAARAPVRCGRDLPRHDVRVVLHRRRRGSRRRRRSRGRAKLAATRLIASVVPRSEDDFVRVARVHEAGAPCRAPPRRRAVARSASVVDAAVDVGVVGARRSGARHRSPRAASASWRRCRGRPAACRGPAGRGSGSRRAARDFEIGQARRSRQRALLAGLLMRGSSRARGASSTSARCAAERHDSHALGDLAANACVSMRRRVRLADAARAQVEERVSSSWPIVAPWLHLTSSASISSCGLRIDFGAVPRAADSRSSAARRSSAHPGARSPGR